MELPRLKTRKVSTLVTGSRKKAATVEDVIDSYCIEFCENKESANGSLDVKVNRSKWIANRDNRRKDKATKVDSSEEADGCSSTEVNVEPTSPKHTQNDLVANEAYQRRKVAQIPGKDVSKSNSDSKDNVQKEIPANESPNSRRRKQKRKKEKQRKKARRQQVAGPTNMKQEDDYISNNDFVLSWIDTLTNGNSPIKMTPTSDALRLPIGKSKYNTPDMLNLDCELPITYYVEQVDDCIIEAQLSPMLSPHATPTNLPATVDLYPTHGRRGSYSAPPSFKSTLPIDSSNESDENVPWMNIYEKNLEPSVFSRVASTYSSHELRPKSLILPLRMEEEKEDHYDLDYLKKQERMLSMKSFDEIMLAENEQLLCKEPRVDKNDIEYGNEDSEETMVEDQKSLDQREDFDVRKNFVDSVSNLCLLEAANLSISEQQQSPHSDRRLKVERDDTTHSDDCLFREPDVQEYEEEHQPRQERGCDLGMVEIDLRLLQQQAKENSTLSLTLRKLKDRLAAKGFSANSSCRGECEGDRYQKGTAQKINKAGGKSTKWAAMKRKTTLNGVTKPMKPLKGQLGQD